MRTEMGHPQDDRAAMRQGLNPSLSAILFLMTANLDPWRSAKILCFDLEELRLQSDLLDFESSFPNRYFSQFEGKEWHLLVAIFGA